MLDIIGFHYIRDRCINSIL